jgi:hypothetical protein
MNRVFRAGGWLLVWLGALMTFGGVLSLTGLTDIHLMFGDVEFNTPAEKGAWIGVWLLAILSGVVLLRTSRRRDSERVHR